MSTPKLAMHRPAGTPDGGQFAPMNRAEATDVRLDGGTAVTSTDVSSAGVTSAGGSTWEQLNAAYAARKQCDDTIERLSAREIADNIRSRFPTATTLHLEDSDQGAHFSATKITDAQGDVLHEIDDWDGDDADLDGEVDTLASNFSNDSISPLLTNAGTRRHPDYRLELAGHGTPTAPDPAGPAVAEPESIDGSAAEPLDNPFMLRAPLSELHQDTLVFVRHPEVQAGAVRDQVMGLDGTVFHRSTPHVHANEPYAMRFQLSRPIDDDEMHQMAGVIGYAYAADVRGEPVGQPVRDSPCSFTIDADTTKSRRDDLGRALEDFEADLPTMIREGSPVRKTDRNGPRGTRLVLGLGDPDLHLEIYYDNVVTW